MLSLLLCGLLPLVDASPVKRQASSATIDCNRFRYIPPLVNSSISGPTWLYPPPNDWGDGDFYLSHSTVFSGLANVQTIFTPINTTVNGSLIEQTDSTSYQVGNATEITTVNATDTILGPVGGYAYNYNVTSPTGNVSYFNAFAFIGWGNDSSGAGFLINYAAAQTATINGNMTTGPPSMSIYSRALGGPNNASFEQIINCVAGLGSNDVLTLARSMMPTIVNGNRAANATFANSTASANNATSTGSALPSATMA